MFFLNFLIFPQSLIFNLYLQLIFSTLSALGISRFLKANHRWRGQVVEVPVVGDTVPGKQQRTAVDLPVLRREAPPEVRMEVVQGGLRG